MNDKPNKTEQSEIVMGNLVKAVELLHNCPAFSALMPEVRVNLVYAMPEARTPYDVAAIDGRITVVRGLPHASGLPKWGASDHMARIIIEARKYDPTINAGINFKCDKVIIEVVKQYCSEKGILFGWVDRTNEPAEVMEHDGASMPWKVKQMVAAYGDVPRLCYEGDGWGKEPLFYAFGEDAVGATETAIEIARRFQKTKG
ncbi:thiamine-phosphate synthase family protein [Chloroflexota bacterium]